MTAPSDARKSACPPSRARKRTRGSAWPRLTSKASGNLSSAWTSSDRGAAERAPEERKLPLRVAATTTAPAKPTTVTNHRVRLMSLSSKRVAGCGRPACAGAGPRISLDGGKVREGEAGAQSSQDLNATAECPGGPSVEIRRPPCSLDSDRCAGAHAGRYGQPLLVTCSVMAGQARAAPA